MSEKCRDCEREFAETLDQFLGAQFCGRELPRAIYNDTDVLERNCFAFGLEQARSRLRDLAEELEREKGQLAAALRRANAAEMERDEWRTSASMACEDPPARCDCAGCRFAEQYRATGLAAQQPQRQLGKE